MGRPHLHLIPSSGGPCSCGADHGQKSEPAKEERKGLTTKGPLQQGPLQKQAPKKLIDFFEKSLLQHFDFERFLIVRTIPFEL
jgi:hypothetical protein